MCVLLEGDLKTQMHFSSKFQQYFHGTRKKKTTEIFIEPQKSKQPWAEITNQEASHSFKIDSKTAINRIVLKQKHTYGPVEWRPYK